MQFELLNWELAFHRRRLDTTDLTLIYDRLAPKWTNKIARLGTSQAYMSLMRRLQAAQMLPRLTDRSRVLDVGIGTGALSLALHHVQPGAWRLDGIDVSRAMLHEAAAQLDAQAVNYQLHLSDLCEMPFTPGEADLVMSAHTLEHLANPVEGLRVLAHQLRPGAPLLLIITRRGWLGALVDAKWGLACPTPAQLPTWLQSAGLTSPQLLTLPGRPWNRYLSLAAIAWRPPA